MANEGVWVDGEYLKFYDANGVQHQGQGTLINSPVGAVRGSWWVDSSDHAYHFISETGKHYTLPFTLVGSVSGAVQGSSFLSSSYIYFINDQNNLVYWYQDTSTYQDQTTSYADTPYGDSTVSHTDGYSDVAASHTDSAHADSHGDATVAHVDHWHADSYSDYGYQDISNPSLHTDVYNDSTASGHGTYYDTAGSHTDSYSDVAHGDITISHADAYNDVPASHTDSAHVDVPASHTDTTVHTDGYGE